ncbi:MAG: ThuA domain-containing protein, partial [Akkermansiaceae bacterium]|nr:ThuA domain-containing protein [Akkermansiaceae bacterium]
MKEILPIGLVAGLALVSLAGKAAADHHEKIKVLYMGGRGHDWKGYYESLAPLLRKQGAFELVPSNKLDDLKAEAIRKFDVVFFFGSGGDFTDPAQEKGLDEFVKEGGGVV